MDICKDVGRKPFDILIHSYPIWQILCQQGGFWLSTFCFLPFFVFFFAILLALFFPFWFFAHSVIQCTSVLICAVEVIMQSVIK